MPSMYMPESRWWSSRPLWRRRLYVPGSTIPCCSTIVRLLLLLLLSMHSRNCSRSRMLHHERVCVRWHAHHGGVVLGHRCLGMRLLLHHHGVLRLSMMLHMMRMRMLLLWVRICGGGLQQRWRTAVATTNSRSLVASVAPATAASTTM